MNSSFTLKQAGYRFHDDSNAATIMGRDYKYCNACPIEGNIKTVTVKRNSLGEIHLYVVCEQEINQVLPRAGKAVGYDFGLKHFLTADDGSTIDSPEWYSGLAEGASAGPQSCVTLPEGNNNRKRALCHLNRVYAKVNRRRDWFFKLANQLVGEYAVICIEDLNLEQMKRLWGRKVSDYAFVNC